jgi:hypothetical protein
MPTLQLLWTPVVKVLALKIDRSRLFVVEVSDRQS